MVEDDYFVALDLEHRLHEAGFFVVGVARTAEEAIDMASRQPDLAIVDIRLAGTRDGIDAAIELLAKSGVRSIFASAHGDQKTRERAEQARPLGWITKPYSWPSLLSLLQAALPQVIRP